MMTPSWFSFRGSLSQQIEIHTFMCPLLHYLSNCINCLLLPYSMTYELLRIGTNIQVLDINWKTFICFMWMKSLSTYASGSFFLFLMALLILMLLCSSYVGSISKGLWMEIYKLPGAMDWSCLCLQFRSWFSASCLSTDPNNIGSCSSSSDCSLFSS